MADFKPDRELEFNEFNETLKTNRTPRDIYNNWPVRSKNLAKVIIGLIIIAILVLIGRSIHHHTENSKTNGATSTSISNKTAANPLQVKNGSNGSNSSNKSSGSTSQAPSANGRSGAIPNTGPGDVVTLFATSAGLATGVHYVINRRRA